MVSSQVAAFQVPPEPFKDHPGTRGRQKQATGKADWITLTTNVYMHELLAN